MNMRGTVVQNKNRVDPFSVNGSFRHLPAVVLGKSTSTALGVIRALGKRGIPVYYLFSDEPDYPVNHSRYIRRQELIADWNPAVLKEVLLGIGSENEKNQIVVFPANDRSLLAYHSIKKELPDYFADTLPPEKIIGLFINKNAFYDYLNELNMPHPRSILWKGEMEVEFLRKNGLEFPLALKPVRTWPFSRIVGKKLLEINSMSDLQRITEKWDFSNIKLMLQELIPGDEFYMVYFFISKKSGVSAVFGSRKIRQSPPEHGIGSLIRAEWRPGLISLTLEFLQKCGYSGIGEAEYKRDSRDGHFKLLEINLRPVTYNRLARQCGLEIEYLAYLDALQQLSHTPRCLLPSRKSLLWVDVRKEIENWLSTGAGSGNFNMLKVYPKVRSNGYWDGQDMRPFWQFAGRLGKGAFKKLFRKSADSDLNESALD
ncbi:MAG: hypothetical protein WAN36_16745 [Calditrichia bacterium]